MEKKTIILLGVGALFVTGLGIYLYNKNKSNASTDDNEGSSNDVPSSSGGSAKKSTTSSSGGGTSSSTPSASSNFDMLLKNTGLKKPSNNILRVNRDSDNVYAQFYTNGRVFVYDAKTNKQIASGNYSDGGKTIVTSKGKTIKSGSVFSNISNMLK